MKRSSSTKWSQALCLQASLHLVDILNSSNLCSCTLRISNAILALMTITFEIFFIFFFEVDIGNCVEVSNNHLFDNMAPKICLVNQF